MDKYSTPRIKEGKICDMEDKEMPYGQRMRKVVVNVQVLLKTVK